VATINQWNPTGGRVATDNLHNQAGDEKINIPMTEAGAAIANRQTKMAITQGMQGAEMNTLLKTASKMAPQTEEWLNFNITPSSYIIEKAAVKRPFCLNRDLADFRGFSDGH
jgi:hypothetical protein